MEDRYYKIFCDSTINYNDIPSDVKPLINNFCNKYDEIINNKYEMDFANIPKNILMNTSNILNKLNNDLFKKIIFSVIINDINNDNIEEFAEKYDLSLDHNTNIIKIINLCYS